MCKVLPFFFVLLICLSCNKTTTNTDLKHRVLELQGVYFKDARMELKNKETDLLLGANVLRKDTIVKDQQAIKLFFEHPFEVGEEISLRCDNMVSCSVLIKEMVSMNRIVQSNFTQSSMNEKIVVK